MLDKKRNYIPTVDLTDTLEPKVPVKKLPVEDLRRRAPTRERIIKKRRSLKKTR